MAKTSNPTKKLVRNANTGELLSVRGLGAMKDMPLPLRRGIDLAKPIAAQILKDKRK
ncbi:hypothetical protein [Rhizobium sp. HT1-10]|uniref:hypothetical protein n=1 Tax=Rhizobium sp. HT1-10 TaxID=3111638 RepID=UPI003C15616D